MTMIYRLHYGDVVATAKVDGTPVDVIFNDPMNQLLDMIVDEVNSTPYGDITIRMGDRVGGDALIQFGSRV